MFFVLNILIIFFDTGRPTDGTKVYAALTLYMIMTFFIILLSAIKFCSMQAWWNEVGVGSGKQGGFPHPYTHT